MLDWLISGDAKVGDRVESKPLKITTAAGMGGAIVAIAGAIPAVVDVFNGTLNDVQLAAALGLVGAGALALSIAWGADAVARAYASAWVVPKSAGAGATPVVQTLAEAVRGGQRPVLYANHRRIIVQPFAGVEANVHQPHEHVLAMEIDDNENIRYLIAGENHTAEWVDSDRVQFMAA